MHAHAPVALAISLALYHRRRYTTLYSFNSVLLRLVAFIFLRIVPAFWGPTLSPVFFFSFAVGWWIIDSRLDAVEREMGKGAGGVMKRQTEKLEEWQKVDKEALGRLETDEQGQVVPPQAEAGGEVVQMARERRPSLQASNGAEATEAKVATDAAAQPKRTYAAVAASPPSSPTRPSRSPARLPPPSSSATGPPLSHHSLRLPRTYPGLLSLPLGLPSRSRVINRFTLVVNLILFLCCLDNSFRQFLPFDAVSHRTLAFSRVGATGETWVKVSARVPPWTPPLTRRVVSAAESVLFQDEVDEAAVPQDIIGARVIYRPTQPVGKWLVGPMLHVSAKSDWVGVVKVEGLFPATEYEYRLVLPDSPSVHHPSFPEVAFFKTFPDHRLSTSSVFTFGTSSCIKTGFPYDPVEGISANPGADILAKWLDSNPLDFFLFLGDFIYADNPWWPGPKLKHYHRMYRQTYGSPSWRKVSRSTPVLHIYDDHEIFNDWSGHAEEGEDNAVFGAANRAYRDYHGVANYDGEGGGENYYWFRHGDAAFFVWDTRRHRSHNFAPDDETKTMLGEKQKQVFFDWLAAVNTTVTFKFVVSSVPLMTLWHSRYVDASDTWAGFLHERASLLAEMAFVPNLVVLSGDRHEFAAATIRDSVLELSTSPLNQFWLPAKSLQPDNALGGVEDHLLKYAPEGRHKFTTIEVDTRTANAPKLLIKLFKDGHQTWNLTYLGRPVRKPPQTVSDLLPSLADWLGLKPSRWFKPYVVNEDIS